MKKVCNVIILVLVIVAIVISVIIFNKYMENYQNEKKKDNLISEINSQLGDLNTDENREMPYIEYEGYQVIGIIKIEKINLLYPILNVNNEDSMKKSITKFYGDKLNQEGNVTLAGHNNFDGTMFGKLKDLEIGDKITILDLNNHSITYEIFNKYVTDPNDVSIVNSTEEGIKEITLVTCTNGNKNRLIIKAKEV
ncbi:MAG: sortase [Clostridia bacterium]